MVVFPFYSAQIFYPPPWPSWPNKTIRNNLERGGPYYDDNDGPDDDFSEASFLDESDDLDLESDLADESADLEPEDPESSFDIEDAFIIGGMIGGMGYAEVMPERQQRDRKRRDED